jgi:hypothetical protein
MCQVGKAFVNKRRENIRGMGVGTAFSTYYAGREGQGPYCYTVWLDVFVYLPYMSEEESVWGYIYYSSVNVIKFLDLKGKVAVIQTPHANFKTKRMSRVFCFNENERLIDRQQVICVRLKTRVVMDKDRNHGDLIVYFTSQPLFMNFLAIRPLVLQQEFFCCFKFIPYILHVQFITLTESNVPKTWGKNYKLQPPLFSFIRYFT